MPGKTIDGGLSGLGAGVAAWLVTVTVQDVTSLMVGLLTAAVLGTRFVLNLRELRRGKVSPTDGKNEKEPK